ncbi:hypothetical protein [Spirochaeta dissipatitropha]
MEPEPIKTIDQLRAIPKYPSIGSILNKYTSAIGGKEFPLGTAKLKKKLQLLSNESSDVDLDSYMDVLTGILESYRMVTDGINFHWIDGAQLYHYFRAYQQLILKFPVLGLSEQLIHNLTAYYFAYMSVQRYAWMIKKFEADAKLHAPHFLVCGNASLQEAFASCINNAKRLLGKPGISDWEFITLLHPEHMGDKERGQSQNKEAIRELVKQLQSWGTTPDSPKYHTFLIKIIEPLRDIDVEAAKILEIDFISWKWLATMLKDSDLAFSDLSSWMSTFFTELLNREDTELHVPSDFIFSDEMLTMSIHILAQSLLAKFTTDDEYYNWQNTSIQQDIFLPEIEESDFDVLWEYVNGLAYCSGSNFTEFSTSVFEYCKKEKLSGIRHVFKKQFLHGIYKFSYTSSTAWIDRQMETLLSDIPKKRIIERDLNKWLAASNKKNVNLPKRWARFDRTRLMMTVTFGSPEQVKKQLALGADVLRISQNSSKQPGDNGTALLFAIQALLESTNPEHFKKTSEILQILMNALKEYPHDRVKEIITLPTNLKKVSPLSCALYLGTSNIIEELLEYKPDLTGELGEDSFYPIYLAMNAYFQHKSMRSPEYLSNIINDGNYNLQRMTTAPAILDLLHNSDSTFQSLAQSSITNLQYLNHREEKQLLKNMYLLAGSGAVPNQMSPNGQYPLDLAYEIAETFGDPSGIHILRDIGEYKRAIR